MIKNKKNLLIFFGELRTFEYVIPFLKNLDMSDIVLSTWSESDYENISFLVDDNLIKKIIPNIKQIHIVNKNSILNIDEKWNTWKLFWHWKNAINNVMNPDEYENVIFHRCDLISNWDSILNLDIEEDVVYLHHNDNPYFHFAKKDEFNNFIYNPKAFWINDYYFFGKFDIVKKFVNLFDKDNYSEPHFPIWEVISENNIKIKNHVLKGSIIRNNTIEYLKELISKNEMNFDCSPLTGPDC